MNAPRMPLGCDQQGRYPEAAEACTELGADVPESERDPRATRTFWVGYVLTCITLASAIGAVVVLTRH